MFRAMLARPRLSLLAAVALYEVADKVSSKWRTAVQRQAYTDDAKVQAASKVDGRRY